MIENIFTCNSYLFIFIPVAFLAGSIPFGIIFTRHLNVDIRQAGSKNIGATNVLRSAGKLPALLTLTGDLLKGALPTGIAALVVSSISESFRTIEFQMLFRDIWVGLVGMAAVLGHMFSIFLKFKGGKGVATGFGFLIAYTPISALVTLLIWITTVAVTKYVSLGAVIAVGLLPAVLYLLHESNIKIIFGLLLAIFVIFRHKSNLREIIAASKSKEGET